MLGERIRKIRKSKIPKMSGERLAELAELSVVTIYNLEAGKIPDVKLDTIDRIAKALQTPIGMLTDDSLTIEAIGAQIYLRSVMEQYLGGGTLAADSGKTSYGTQLTEEVKKIARSGHEGKTAPTPTFLAGRRRRKKSA